MTSANFITEIVSGLTSSIGGIASALGEGVVSAFKGLMIQGTGESTATTLVFATVVVSAGIAITVSLFRRATHLLRLKHRA